MTTNRIKSALCALTLLAGVAAMPSAAIAQALPGEGKTVKYARATWDTFWVGGQIIAIGLERLGYKVDRPATLATNVIHEAVSSGQAQFSADAISPLHNDLKIKYQDSVVWAGEISNPASVAGYLIDKKTAEQHGIKYLDQLRDPKLAELFGGGGKARLMGIDPSWSAVTVKGIKSDVERFGLSATVIVQSGSYDLIMSEAVTRYREGKPVLIYSWYPNMYTQKMLPGKDLVWLSFRADQGRPGVNAEKALVGCAAKGPECFGVSTLVYHVIANKTWLSQNPAAAKFISLARMSMSDRGVQNLKMAESGQRSDSAIRSHADEWIARNKVQFDAWIAESLKAK